MSKRYLLTSTATLKLWILQAGVHKSASQSDLPYNKRPKRILLYIYIFSLYCTHGVNLTNSQMHPFNIDQFYYWWKGKFESFPAVQTEANHAKSVLYFRWSWVRGRGLKLPPRGLYTTWLLDSKIGTISCCRYTFYIGFGKAKNNIGNKRIISNC